MKSFIDIDKISYSYPVYEEENSGTCLKALNAVDLQVEKGQFICILGSNGSGKSTLARHLNALLIPNEGTVWISEMNTADESLLWSIRSQVGMVFQNPDNQMIASKVDEEVAFGLENLGVASDEIIIRVSKALDSVGLSEYENENPLNLSGGQKQRVAVAGVLAMRPECIVLDESTAMLDPKGRKEIMDTVLDINRRLGVTIICITHFMEEAIDADRIFVMDNGRIVLSGNAREIFSREEELEKAGIVLPVICQIISKLRSFGLDIPADIITADELRKYLIEHHT